MFMQVKDLIDKKVIEATDKLAQQLLASIALYTVASIGKVRGSVTKQMFCKLWWCDVRTQVVCVAPSAGFRRNHRGTNFECWCCLETHT